MTEAQACYIMICVAIVAAGLLVWFLGKPEPVAARVAEQPQRFSVYSSAGVLMLQTDDPEEAEKARRFYAGRIQEWQ